MQYNLHDYIEKVAKEIQRLALERNASNEQVAAALAESTGDMKECETFMAVVQRAIDADKMYSYYSARMGDLKRQADELAAAEKTRDAAFAKYVERCRSHMQTYGGMQAAPDIINHGGAVQQAIARVAALSLIEVEERYRL